MFIRNEKLYLPVNCIALNCIALNCFDDNNFCIRKFNLSDSEKQLF